MLNWCRLTPEQWSAIGTVVSAFVSILNLIVVINFVGYNKRSTQIMELQAEDMRKQTSVALQTLTELNLEKRKQKYREVLRVQGRLKDMGDHLLVLEHALKFTPFTPSEWKAKPDDWSEIGEMIIANWQEGIQRVTNLEQRLRAIDIKLQSLARVHMTTMETQATKDQLKTLVEETSPLIREIWEGMMTAATH